MVENTAIDFNMIEIRKVLRKYFEYDDNGNPNKEYDPNFSANDAVDEIYQIVGKI